MLRKRWGRDRQSGVTLSKTFHYFGRLRLANGHQRRSNDHTQLARRMGLVSHWSSCSRRFVPPWKVRPAGAVGRMAESVDGSAGEASIQPPSKDVRFFSDTGRKLLK